MEPAPRIGKIWTNAFRLMESKVRASKINADISIPLRIWLYFCKNVFDIWRQKNVFFSKVFENFENLRNQSGSVQSGRKIWIEHAKWCRTAYSMPKTDVWRLWKNWKENVGGVRSTLLFFKNTEYVKKNSREFPPTFSYRLFHGITHLFRMFMPCDCISFSKTPKISKKNRESSPLHFHICFFTGLRHPLSACSTAFYIISCALFEFLYYSWHFQLRASRTPIWKKWRESPPTFSNQFFHRPETSVFGMLNAILYHFLCSKTIILSFQTLPNWFRIFSEFSKIFQKMTFFFIICRTRFCFVSTEFATELRYRHWSWKLSLISPMMW